MCREPSSPVRSVHEAQNAHVLTKSQLLFVDNDGNHVTGGLLEGKHQEEDKQEASHSASNVEMLRRPRKRLDLEVTPGNNRVDAGVFVN
jgi:hypothetical protein